MTLLPHHAELIAASAIEPEVAAERGYYSETVGARLHDLGFPASLATALVNPIHGTTGEIVGHQVRPDSPRSGKNGKPRKYETPFRARNRLDVHPRSLAALGNPSLPLVITEGVRKGDAAVSVGLCVVSLTGVWNWRGKNDQGGLVALPDWHDVALNERRVYLGFDSDSWENPDVYAALVELREWLQAHAADVRIIYLPTLDGGAKCGLDDYLAAGHTRDDLLALASAKLRNAPERKATPSKPTVPAPETAALISAIEKVFTRFLVLSDDAHAFVLALFVIHTWAFDAAETTPYITIVSPEKRSGKTRLLEVLKPLCKGALHTSSVTEAAIYQVVEHFGSPTLLIDEIDAIFASTSDRAEALRGIINAGNRRGVPAIRGGQDGTPLVYEAFCPKVLAGINTGRLPDTIQDRSIVLPMERKLRATPVERLKSRKLAAELEHVRAQLHAWAHAHGARLDGWEVPEPISAIDDRAEEAWEPLLAIAATAGPQHYQRACEVACGLAKGTTAATDSASHKLLMATCEVFGDDDRVTSADLARRLNAHADLGYSDWNEGKGIRPTDVARYLKPYRIRPGTIRLDDEKTAKGYYCAPLKEAWKRYLPPAEGESQPDPKTGADTLFGPSEGSFAVTPVTTAAQSRKRDFEVPSQTVVVTANRNAANPHSKADVTGVTATNAGNGQKRDATPSNGHPTPDLMGALEGHDEHRPASGLDPDLYVSEPKETER